MPLIGTNIVRKNRIKNRINRINHDISEIAQDHPIPDKITKNQPNALAPAMPDLNVVCF